MSEGSETNEATSNSGVGIVLVLLACLCYASGNCLQRYSLLRRKGEKVFYVLNRNLGWLLGAIIYFSANGIYAVALSFAPVSVLAAVFSLTIVCNATIAYFALGDQVPRKAIPGYIAVLAGSVVFSVTVQAEVCHFDGANLKEVMMSPAALVYWIVMYLIILGGSLFAYPFEKKFPVLNEDEEDEAASKQQEGDASVASQPATNKKQLQHKATTQMTDLEDSDGLPEDTGSVTPDDENVEMQYASKPEGGTNNPQPARPEPSSFMLLLAGFIYPSSLGATEAVGALILKGVNSLLTTMAYEEEDETVEVDSHLDLWIVFFGLGVFIFGGIVIWLRLTYSRFEITAAFPVEFGMLTFASVVGGFAVFEDHQYVEGTSDWAGVVAASLLILGGIATVGWASWDAHQQEHNHQQ